MSLQTSRPRFSLRTYLSHVIHMCSAKNFFLAFTAVSNSSWMFFNSFFVVLGMPIKVVVIGLHVHSPVMAPIWWYNFNVFWGVVVQISICLQMSSPRKFNNTVFISIETEFVVPLARLYQLPSRFFTRSRKAVESTPSCAWTFLLLLSISSKIWLNLFSCVPAMLIVDVVVDARIYDPVMDPNWWHPFNVVWFIVVFQNLGFSNSSYVILCRIRAISWLEFLVVLFSYTCKTLQLVVKTLCF